MSVVVKLGGHLISAKKIQAARIKEYAEIFTRIDRSGTRLVVVTGGGDVAREYCDAAMELGGSQVFRDELGVMASRINAHLLICALGERAYPAVPTSTEQIREFASSGMIVVSGGLQPAQSTVAVSALAAESVGAEKLVLATDVKGVYSRDPKKHPNARLLREMTFKQLEKMILAQPQLPGEYKLFDLLSVRILQRSRIPCFVVDGSVPSNVESAMTGKKVGTIIRA